MGKTDYKKEVLNYWGVELGEVREKNSFNDTLKHTQPPQILLSLILPKQLYFGCAGPSLLRQGFL